MLTILLLDDDINSLDKTTQVLIQHGFDVFGISDVSHIYSIYAELSPFMTVLKSSKEFVEDICNEIHQMDRSKVANIIINCIKQRKNNYDDCEKYKHYNEPPENDLFCVQIKTILNNMATTS